MKDGLCRWSSGQSDSLKDKQVPGLIPAPNTIRPRTLEGKQKNRIGNDDTLKYHVMVLTQ